MENRLTVATFNANSVRSRLTIISRWLEARAPDLLCLQETKVQDEHFPVKAFEQLGYHVVFKGEKRYNGVAIASRLPLDRVSFGLGDGGPRDEARLIEAHLRGLTVINTYVPQGTDPDDPRFLYKLQWFDRLLDLFRSRFSPQDPILWVGDLNVAPEPIDVYDPDALAGQVCFHPQEREAFRRVLSWGFVDVFRRHCKEARQFSFWDYRTRDAPKRDLGWRLDHILATVPLAERSVDAFIDKDPRMEEKPSDHTFVAAAFEIPGAENAIW